MYRHLRPETGESSTGPWHCLRFVGATSWLSIVCLGIAIGFLAALVHRLAFATYGGSSATAAPMNVTLNCSDALVPDNTTCALSHDCLQGFWNDADSTCAYRPRPTNVTGCSSPCFSPLLGATHCNAGGHCIGDRAACHGTCEDSNDCDVEVKFQLNTKLVVSAASPSLWPYSSWYEPYGCWYGQCILAILEIYVASSTRPIYINGTNTTYNFTALSAHTACETYLMPEFVTTHRPCLGISRVALASSMVNYTEIGNNVFGNSTLPFQLSVCLFRFTCGVSSEDGSADVNEGAKKRTRMLDEAPVYKSAEEWGFVPVSPADRTPLGAGVRPQMHNAFWAKTREVVQRGLGPFLNRVLRDAPVSE
jgi:hypothetical protein